MKVEFKRLGDDNVYEMLIYKKLLWWWKFQYCYGRMFDTNEVMLYGHFLKNMGIQVIYPEDMSQKND